jgi:hypothetical protein
MPPGTAYFLCIFNWLATTLPANDKRRMQFELSGRKPAVGHGKALYRGINTNARRRHTLITTSHSTVIDHRLATTWALIRDFNSYPAYIDGVTDSTIEDQRRGDEVGAVRRFCYGGVWLRQRLHAHSDEQSSLSYVGLSPFEYPDGLVDERPPPAAYEGTIRLLPVVDEDRTCVEWSVSVDASPAHADSWRTLLMKLIPDWTESLRRTLDRRAA